MDWQGRPPCQPGPFLSPSSWLCSSGAFPRGLAVEGSPLCVSLPDLSQMGSHVRAGTALTPVYTPTPGSWRWGWQTRPTGTGFMLSSLQSQELPLPSVSLSLRLFLSLSLFPHPLSSGALLQDTFLTARGSRGPRGALQHPSECSQARGGAEEEGM